MTKIQHVHHRVGKDNYTSVTQVFYYFLLHIHTHTYKHNKKYNMYIIVLVKEIKPKYETLTLSI